MKRRLLPILVLLAGICGAPPLGAQEAVQKKEVLKTLPVEPIMVGGTEFLILDPLPQKKVERAQKRVSAFVVVLAWIGAMLLWQVYFNRKSRRKTGE